MNYGGIMCPVLPIRGQVMKPGWKVTSYDVERICKK